VSSQASTHPGFDDETPDDVIDKAAALAAQKRRSSGPPPETAEQFVRQYYRHVAAEDLVGRADVDVYGAALSQYRQATERPQGTAKLHVFTPTVAEHGWSADGRTVVEIVTDDMPFLVDSVTMELNEEGRSVQLVIHPMLLVRRDITGQLVEVLDDEGYVTGVAGADPEVSRESWMHVEIDREADAAELARIQDVLSGVLSDVREAVEDWERMRQQALRIVEDLDANPPPLPPGEVERGKQLLTWLADDHFTFLGYREYRLEEVEDDTVLRALPGTGK